MLCDLYAIPSHNHQVYYASWRNFQSEKQGNHENLIAIGEHAGSGVPDIYSVWADNGSVSE